MTDDLKGLATREQPAPINTGEPVWPQAIHDYAVNAYWRERVLNDAELSAGDLGDIIADTTVAIERIGAYLHWDKLDLRQTRAERTRVIRELIAADMAERDAVGRERYGVPLCTRNGRDFLVDAYQELLDALVYLTGKLMEVTE